MSLYNDLTTVLTPYANKIKQNESDIGDIQDALEHLDVDTDKTLSIEGKPADAKAVGDAVKPVQTDVSEHTTELALLITKTEKPKPEPTEIVQCADLSKARLESKKRYWNVKIELPWIGRYDMNPSNLNLRFWYMRPYDSSGNKLQLYRGGSAFSSLQINNGGYFEKVDNRTIKTYKPSGALDWTWHTDGDISYLGFDDGSVYSAYIGEFEDPAQLVGVTYGGTSETYIPYGSSVVPDTPPEYDYEYSADLMSAIHDGLVETYTDDEPTQDSTNFVKSGGVISYLLKETYNLIDPLWFDWSDASADYITLKTGLYIPVEAGRVLLSNAEKVRYTFYNSEKVSIDTVGSAVAYAPVAIPSNSAYMTCVLNNQSSGYIPSDHKIVIYYSDNTASPRDDIRDYIGHMNLQGMRGSNEIFDYYAPTALDKEVLQMAKYSAVRNINFCNNVLRIGTFNMYNPRRDYGWKTAKKMFADFAVDIVGFQEVSNAGVLTEFLKGWQFTDGVTWTNRAIASHFKVLSYDTYSISVTNNTFMRAIIQLPRYADVINPTLSVYDYHGIWDGGTPEKRAQEVSEILAVITQDTSDFIVVVGDTNAQSPSEWDTWRNAGFTPVHDGNGVITTIDEYCIDNVFYGSGITCKNYHVVPAEDYLVTISGEDLPISDHDFVFADLQFDFDSLIRS